MRRLIAIILTVMLAVPTLFIKDAAHAAENDDSNYKAIGIYVNDESKPRITLTLKDLEDIEKAEGSQRYTYSGYNRNVTFKYKGLEAVHGPSLEGILNKANIYIGKASISDNEDKIVLNNDDEIRISGYDEMSYTYLVGQIFADRYYFPKACVDVNNPQNDGYVIGDAVKPETMEGKVKVPPILSLDAREDGDEDSKRIDRIVFGQEYPNEQTYQYFMKCMIDYKNKKEPSKIRLSKIRVITNTLPENWQNVTGSSKPSGAEVSLGTKIELMSDYDTERDHNLIVYTTDGTEPTLASEKYNYSKYDDIRPITIDKFGENIIKVRTVGFGRKDSEVKTFRYIGVVGTPESFSAVAPNYNTAKISWDWNDSAAGYILECSTGGAYETVATLTQNDKPSSGKRYTYTHKNLKTYSYYNYRLRAFCDTENGKVYSKYTINKRIRPVLGKLSIQEIYQKKKGDKTARIQWKRVEGASAYEVYRSNYKTKKFKKIVTRKGANSVTWNNKKLKKGKRYYYKVKAYRIVNGKKLYGSYSSVRSVRIR